MKRHIRRTSRHTQLFLVAVFVLMGPTAGILQAREIRSITLGEAIQIALENNLDLKRSSNQVAASELSVQQARADFYPNLNASVSTSEGYSRRVDPISDQTEGRGSQSLNVRLSSNVTLFNGFGNVASLEKSELDLAATEKSFSRTRESITFETISQFLQVLQDKELIQSEAENLEAQRGQLRRIEEFYKAGNRSMADVLQQRAMIAQAELRVLSAQRSLNVSKLRLLKTMGLEPTMDVEIAELPAEQLARLTSDLIPCDSERMLEKALTKRADVQARKMQIAAAQKQIRAARAGYWPALSLSADAGTGYSSLNEWGGFSDQLFDSSPNAGIGLALSIPIFDRSRTRHSVAQAEVQLANERLNMESLKQEVAFQIQQAVLDCETAAKQLDVAEAQLTSARRALEVTEARYNVGSATLVELAQFRAQYVEATNDRVKARTNLLLNRVTAEYV
ncbi:MAG: TolC family protein, partial [Candidatus Latescibacteria bacterium]|nr:TolC family protein [Candidatus Latescibacterota bacterium]